jgi:cell division protein FtsZ
MGLEDVEAAANLVQEAAHPDANIIFGATFDDTMQDEIRVTVIATGFDQNANAPELSTAAAPGAGSRGGEKRSSVGLFTGAAEKASATMTPPVVSAAPSAAPAAAAAPDAAAENGGEEDPFDSIFKIFNTK